MRIEKLEKQLTDVAETIAEAYLLEADWNKSRDSEIHTQLINAVDAIAKLRVALLNLRNSHS